MNYMIFGWLGALILFIIIEIATVNLATIWFAGGALIALILSLFDAPMVAQIVAFFVVSSALLTFARPFFERILNRDKIKTNVESLIGMNARVTEVINNIEGIGTAVINGQEWTARAADDETVIPIGEIVTIVDIKGVKLIVK